MSRDLKLRLVPGCFYQALNGELWCCYAIDEKAEEHCRAWCVWVGSRGRPRAEYFYMDGRYDAEGKREHTLVDEYPAHMVSAYMAGRR